MFCSGEESALLLSTMSPRGYADILYKPTPLFADHFPDFFFFKILQINFFSRSFSLLWQFIYCMLTILHYVQKINQPKWRNNSIMQKGEFQYKTCSYLIDTTFFSMNPLIYNVFRNICLYQSTGHNNNTSTNGVGTSTIIDRKGI